MKRTRLYVNQPLVSGGETRLDEKSSHYLRNVLRLREDAVLYAFNGEGGCYIARVTSVTRRGVTIVPEQHLAEERESGLDLTLAQGIAKGQKMDYTIRKAVELGVNRIVPVVTEFSQVRLSAGRADKRLSHWQGIVISACEQCGRNRLPAVVSPVALNEWLQEEGEQTKLIMDPGSPVSIADIDPPPAGRLALLAGPEGGFSDRDRQSAEQAGYRGVSLGPRILRTETAALAALAVCQVLWGDFGTRNEGGG